MLLLGFGRLASVKGSGYHEHVTEYGVHWNFFFTLAVSKVGIEIRSIFRFYVLLLSTQVLVSLCFTVVNVRHAWPASLCVALVHEAGLTLGLAEWVLDSPVGEDRLTRGLVFANKEGIVSCPGYVAIFLAGVTWGASFSSKEWTLKEAEEESKRLGKSWSCFDSLTFFDPLSNQVFGLW